VSGNGQRVSFKTVGCRLNQAETATLAGRFQAAGYVPVPFGEPCDVCVINTCTVTGRAEKDCISLARSMRRKLPDSFIVLAGCAAEVDAERIREASGADMVAGQQEKWRLPGNLPTRVGSGSPQSRPPGDMMKAVSVTGGRGFDEPRTDMDRRVVPRFDTTRALVKVQDGCDFHCAYCIVPRARGLPVSIPAATVIDEVRRLVDSGYREVVLTGANLGCYRDGGLGLVHLLEQLEALDGLKRTRLSSIELSTTERDVIDFMAGSRKLCRYIHLPMQSGDDRILAAMGRRYTAREYAGLVEYAAGKVALLGLGADIIVGFPGEREDHFINTLAMVKDLPFSNLHVFPYSPRPGTRAASMEEQVSATEKSRRVATLVELGETKKGQFAERFIGRKVAVLVEKVDSSGAAHGWTGEYVRARTRADGRKLNDIVSFVPGRVEGTTLVDQRQKNRTPNNQHPTSNAQAASR